MFENCRHLTAEEMIHISAEYLNKNKSKSIFNDVFKTTLRDNGLYFINIKKSIYEISLLDI